MRQRSNLGRTVEIACNDLDGAQAEEIKERFWKLPRRNKHAGGNSSGSSTSPSATKRSGSLRRRNQGLIKSGGAPPNSKTQARNISGRSRPRFGVRRCFTALVRFASGNTRKTTRCGRQSLKISIGGRNVDICRLCRDAAAATILASNSHSRWHRLPFSECDAWRGKAS